MTIARNILLALHLLGLVGLLGALLSQLPKPQKRILGGAMHSALLSLISGIALVGINTSLHATDPEKWMEVDHTKVGIKFLILIVILVFGYKSVKKPSVSTKLWALLIALTLANVFIATAL